MEAYFTTFPLTILFNNDQQITKIYPNNCSLDYLITELCNYFQTKRKNLMRFVEISFDGKNYKDFFWEVSFQELIQKKISVTFKLNYPYNQPAESKGLIRSSKINKLNKNLCNYLFDFLDHNYISSVYNVNKRFFSYIGWRKNK
jgi:hypothetical protein